MDVNKNAFRIVQKLTGAKVENKRAATARAGGKTGGPARAKALSPERRKEIAIGANRARWSKNNRLSQ